jgi:acetyl-CoA carboxylase biotin carboxyl carrier protein
MEPKFIKELIQLVNDSSLAKVEIEQEGFKIKITKSIRSADTTNAAPALYAPPTSPIVSPISPPAPLAPTPPTAADSGASPSSSNLFTVLSPMVGTFYRASAPDKPNYVNVGDIIHKGQVLCIIEAMKLFNEIESEVSGKVVKILVENAQPVEYEQPLFVIELS